jgi:DNA-binding response OmpR family regulator
MRKPRAFIYDDDKGILRVLEYFFLLRGYDVCAHERPVACPIDPGASLCLSPHACADVIITDFMMPELNGIDLLTFQSRKGCKIPIRSKALISGFVEERDMNRLRELGCAFFNKPFNLDDLAGWLDEREQEMDLSQPLNTLGTTAEGADHPAGMAMTATR